MDNIIEPRLNYDFSGMFLGPPTNPSGGTYFTRLLSNNRPIFIQVPKCISKNGFVKNNKRIYVDFLFDSSDSVFANWIENLEANCVKLLYANREDLFQNDIDKDDIENAFSSLIKIYKSGKYFVIRVMAKSSIRINSEDNMLKTMDDVLPSTNIVSIIEIQGIKYTSRNFQIEVDLKQVMIVSDDPFLDACYIKTSRKKNEINNSPSVSSILLAQSELELKLEPELNSEPEPEPEPELKPELEAELELELAPKSKLAEEHSIQLQPERDQNHDEITTEIEEVQNLDINDDDDDDTHTITLKTSTDIHMEMYMNAKKNADKLREDARLAILELENIKKLYGINEKDDL